MEKLILVVDDERLIADLTAEVLEREGYCCRALYGGREAIAALNSNDVSVIVSDVNMPVVGGLELAAHARKHCPRAKVLLMSGGEVREDIAQEFGCEGCEFLAKPFGRQELLRAIGKMMES